MCVYLWLPGVTRSRVALAIASHSCVASGSSSWSSPEGGTLGLRGEERGLTFDGVTLAHKKPAVKRIRIGWHTIRARHPGGIALRGTRDRRGTRVNRRGTCGAAAGAALSPAWVRRSSRGSGQSPAIQEGRALGGVSLRIRSEGRAC